MPPTSIEQNQADYTGRYTPIDAPRYQADQAQTYYERMRSQVNERSKSLLVGSQGFHTEGAGSSMYSVAGAGRHEPQRREYRTKSRRDRAEARDVVERTLSAPMNFYDAFNEFGAEFGVAEPFDQKVATPFFKGVFGAGGGAGGVSMTSAAGLKTMGHGMLAGTAVGLGAYYGAEAGIQYTGIREGFNQFEEIRNLRGSSRPMTAGVASGPNGRMSRDMAQNIVTDMSEEARLSNLEREGESLDEMKEQAGILADYQLLEGARSADEFEKTFKRLKEGVKKVMEVMGTTFEEGTKLMKDFRNAGVSPMQGVQMINQGRLTSAQFGNNFQEGHASGMQSAMAMRRTGFSMGAGYQMGQFASGMSQTIYEGNYLDDKTMYNLGGQRGVQQALQRSSMRFMESPDFTAMMMGAQRPSGEFSRNTIMQTLAGNRGMQENARAAGQNISSLEDILSFRANNRGFISDMVETNPAMLEGLKVQSVIDRAEQAGYAPGELSQDQLAEFAGMNGMMSPDAFRASVAAVEALPETIGRRRREERRTAESRARDMYRTGTLETMAEGIREQDSFRSFMETSTAMTIGARENIYDFQKTVTNTLMREFQGQRMVEGSGQAATFFSELEDVDGGEGGIYRDANDLFATSEGADILEVYAENRSEQIDSLVRVNDDQIYDDRVALDEEQRKRLGLSKEEGTEVQNVGTMYDMSQLRESDLIGVMGDPSVEEGDEMMSSLFEESYPFGTFREGGSDFLSGAASLATGQQEFMIMKGEELNEQQVADKQFSKAFELARGEQIEDANITDLSEEAAKEYETLFEGQVSREDLLEVRQDAGEDGTEEVSRFYQRTLKDRLNIDAELYTPEFKQEVLKRFEQDESLREAFGFHVQQLSARGIEQQNREMETYLDSGGISDMESILDTGMEVLNTTTDDRFDSERNAFQDFFNLDVGIENRIDSSTFARDAMLARMYVESNGGVEALSKGQRERYEEMQQRAKSRFNLGEEDLTEMTDDYEDQIEENAEISKRDLFESLSSAGEQGILGGSGEQSAAASGVSQEYASKRDELQSEMADKMMELAKLLQRIERQSAQTQANQKKQTEDAAGGPGGHTVGGEPADMW